MCFMDEGLCGTYTTEVYLVNTCRDSCLCLRVIADEWRSDVLELIFVFITNKEIKAKQITSGSLHFNYRQYKRVIDP